MPSPYRVALILLALLVGCLPQTGEDAVLLFRYARAGGDLLPVSASTAVAVGARADVIVARAGTYPNPEDRPAASILGATSDAPGVLAVDGFEGNRLRLTALAAGSARIQVRTEAGDDAFTVQTAALASVELKQACYPLSGGSPCPVVRDGRARFAVELRDAAGRRLAGEALRPVTFTPEEGAEALAAPEDSVTGALEVIPKVEGTLLIHPEAGPDASLEVLPPEAITELDLDGGALHTVPVQGANLLSLHGLTAEGRRVSGLSELAAPVSDTPGTCAIELLPALGTDLFLIRGVSEGDCDVTATFGELVATLQLTVTPPKAED